MLKFYYDNFLVLWPKVPLCLIMIKFGFQYTNKLLKFALKSLQISVMYTEMVFVVDVLEGLKKRFKAMCFPSPTSGLRQQMMKNSGLNMSYFSQKN